jgi:hypothetical protein
MGFTSWTKVGSPTVTAATTTKRHGTQSAKVVASGAVGQLTQAPTLNVDSVVDRSAVFKAWVYATAASTARLRLDWDGSAFENGDYHSGNDQWELLEASGDIPDSATQVKVICEVADGGTAYFDASFLAVEPIFKYTVPSSILKGPTFITQQYDESDPNGEYYPIGAGGARSGMRLRVEGYGALTETTADTGTVEVDSIRAELLATVAAENLLRTQARRRTGARKEELLDAAIDLRALSNELKGNGTRMPRTGAQIPTDYEIQEDASGRYIMLTKPRAGISA